MNKTTKMETDNEVEVWHAMRATYRRELDAVHLLENQIHAVRRRGQYERADK